MCVWINALKIKYVINGRCVIWVIASVSNWVESIRFLISKSQRYMHVWEKKLTFVMHYLVKVGFWKSGKPVEHK